MEYYADFTPADIAEIVMILRTRKLKKNEEGFCKMFPPLTLKNLRRLENGSGTYGIYFLYRLQKEGYIKVSISVEM